GVQRGIREVSADDDLAEAGAEAASARDRRRRISLRRPAGDRLRRRLDAPRAPSRVRRRARALAGFQEARRRVRPRSGEPADHGLRRPRGPRSDQALSRRRRGASRLQSESGEGRRGAARARPLRGAHAQDLRAGGSRAAPAGRQVVTASRFVYRIAQSRGRTGRCPHRTGPVDSSQADSTEVAMFESCSAWSSTVLVTTCGTRSRLPKLRSANGENSMSRFAWLATCLVVLSALTVVGLVHVPDAAAQKKVLNIAAKEPDTLDPHSSTLGQSQAISRFRFRGLTRFAIKDGKVTTAEVEPDLAESWTLSPEGTIWTIKLKKGVQFHKGYGEMTAEDVKFSFERQINKAPGT